MVRRKSGRNSTALEQKHLLFLVGFLIFACVALHLFFHYFLNSTQPEATGPFRELSWPSTKNRCHQIAPVAFNLSVSQKGSRTLRACEVDFLIIGCMKCGSTSTASILKQHPLVTIPFSREPHYFTKQYFETSFDDYIARFPLTGVVGEKSNSYMYHPDAPLRVRRVFPNAKIIAVLRDPIIRAWSHYKMFISLKSHDIPLSVSGIYRQLKEQINFLNSCQTSSHVNIWRSCFKDASTIVTDRAYVARGVYIDQLLEWFSVFPHDQVLVLCFEELETSVNTFAKKLYEFLGLPDNDSLGSTPVFKLYSGSSSQLEVQNALDGAIYHLLYDFYKPYNERLRQQLGIVCPWNAA